MRVLLVEGHPLIRSGVERLLTGAHLSVVAAVGHAAAARRALEDHAVDVVVLDLRLPARARGAPTSRVGLNLLGHLRARWPERRALVFSPLKDEALILEAFARGAWGYVPKDAPPRELVGALLALEKGERFLPPELVPPRVRQRLLRGKPCPPVPLSRGDLTLLRALKAGLTLAQIAERCGTTPKAVEHRRARLLKRLRLATTADLIRYAYRHQL